MIALLVDIVQAVPSKAVYDFEQLKEEESIWLFFIAEIPAHELHSFYNL